MIIVFIAMDSIDRTLAPEVSIAPFEAPRQPNLQKSFQHETRKFFAWHNNQHPYLKISFIFPFSNFDFNNRLIPHFTMNLIPMGTKSKNWNEISDIFDFYGTNLLADSTDIVTEFTITFLHKFLPDILELLADVFLHANFQEEPFELVRVREIQDFKTRMNKVSVLTDRELRRLTLKGTHLEHLAELKNYEDITREEIFNFYQEYYPGGPQLIAVIGGTEKHAETIYDFFNAIWKNPPLPKNTFFNPTPLSGTHYVHKPKALQSSIRLGIFVPHYNHPDFPKLKVLCTLLSGYFTSRLNQNLREEKGYTYGVHGYFLSYRNLLQYHIHTEVGTEVTQAALKEIRKEIEKLAHDDFPDEELQNLANYQSGVFLKDTNGIFENAGSWLNSYLRNLTLEVRKNVYDAFFNTRPEELRALAKKYLNPDHFTVAVAGDLDKIGKE
ncbi:MAG: insulinase family protein [Bacteroidia bacterium]|nr:insulinase family protein [Bacteroidia bacterium]